MIFKRVKSNQILAQTQKKKMIMKREISKIDFVLVFMFKLAS